MRASNTAVGMQHSYDGMLRREDMPAYLLLGHEPTPPLKRAEGVYDHQNRQRHIHARYDIHSPLGHHLSLPLRGGCYREAQHSRRDPAHRHRHSGPGQKRAFVGCRHSRTVTAHATWNDKHVIGPDSRTKVRLWLHPHWNLARELQFSSCSVHSGAPHVIKKRVHLRRLLLC
jgi:hypothetical protein